MDILLALCIGVTLSAACGFRIFVPPLIMSAGAIYGDFALGESFAWMGTYPALIAFAVATGAEVMAYYVPVVDNLLDAIEIPTAIAIGSLIMSASLGAVTELEPLLQWAIAIAAGGSTAGIIESFTVVTRGASTAMTGGTANPIMSTAEVLSAGVLSLLALFVPLLAIFVVFAVLGLALQRLSRLFKRKSTSNNSQL
ncbi:hypothetical protein Lepto7376_2782 [[Leptolyngbya] sp. PCC 7376]|uniref:DUF4126 domain-containing protein n=1 Tax=[Leptolyngbya] sp. PCC 7376 TaxID=111781 RepID=UPI00029F036A|nr:DUF4126 domain-containing protein [[Leptolyngbya] sp. PCC 7376]AFY39039.1 hypothetical protein Lepto7376_2782 [[Leptolyngbya] sp. PCC 7376]